MEKTKKKSGFGKRFIFIIIAAAVLFSALAATGIIGFGERIENRLEEAHDGFGEERHGGEGFRHLSLSGSEKAALCVSGAILLVLAALFVFYRISVAQWLFSQAGTLEMNRALWPMLGLVFGIFAVCALLIIRENPRRIKKI